MKDDSAVYIISEAQSVKPLAVSGSLKNLIENLGDKELLEKRREIFKQFNENGQYLHNYSGKKFRFTRLWLKDGFNI